MSTLKSIGCFLLYLAFVIALSIIVNVFPGGVYWLFLILPIIIVVVERMIRSEDESPSNY